MMLSAMTSSNINIFMYVGGNLHTFSLYFCNGIVIAESHSQFVTSRGTSDMLD